MKLKAILIGTIAALALSAASARPMPNANQTPEAPATGTMPNANQTPEAPATGTMPNANGTTTSDDSVNAAGTMNGGAAPLPPHQPPPSQCVPGALPVCPPPNPGCPVGVAPQVGTACPPPILPQPQG